MLLMNKKKTVVYGTLEECVNEYYKRIDFENGTAPNVDYAASVWEDCEDVLDAYESAEGWFGIKDISEEFNSDTVTLLFGHYGGGGVESLELYGDDPETEKEILMQRIGSSTDDCGYGVLEPQDYTVFELFSKKEDKRK